MCVISVIKRSFLKFAVILCLMSEFHGLQLEQNKGSTKKTEDKQSDKREFRLETFGFSSTIKMLL